MNKLRDRVEDREVWHAAVHGVAESDRTQRLNNNNSRLTVWWQFQVPCRVTQPYIYMSPFSLKLPFPPGCSIIVSRVPWAIQQDLVDYPFFLIYYLFVAVLDLCCCTDFSLVVLSRNYSLVAGHGFLIEVVSLISEHRLQGEQASVAGVQGSVVVVPGLQSRSSTVVVHGLSFLAACGTFLNQGPNPSLPHLPMSHQGSPYLFLI